MNKHFEWIDYAKGIAILLVVLGHAFPDASAVGGAKNDYIRVLREFIYQFHMPLLFFISGMLSGRILRLQDYKGRCEYIKDRCLRLLVPYFAIAIMYLPFKMALSSFANQPYDIYGIWKILLGENPDGGLWFLYALFLIQAAMALIVKREDVRAFLLVGILAGLLTIVFQTHWYWVDDAIFYFSFVMMGLCFSMSGLFDSGCNRNMLWGTLFLLVGSISIYFYTHSPFCKFFSGIFGSFLVICLSKKIEELSAPKGNKMIGGLKILGDYTMDIYIFHGILMVVVRIVFWSILHWNYYLCCVLMLLVGLILPIFISKKIVRPIPFLRKVFIGDFK